jgi:hypothetical protein
MFFQSSRGIRVRKSTFAFVGWLLILLRGFSVLGQTPDTVLATVNNTEITQKQVDDLVATKIFPLQQQLYAMRKAALENLVTTRLLESEAKSRGMSIDELRRQLTRGDVDVTPAQVEEAYKQNATFFA